ncbi:MAG: hypothetical protein JXR46_10785 [Calditrichaceae bacterium]|nr:hypothetical protein [Calditrichaceae bacterium]MBN2709518.1 hypothetical protein [Calditrichaceae bacterium]RQV93126.1 MAG: hypothetical protein EH224_13255 [Calditrichota bacterium]
MPILQVRNLPSEIYNKLRLKAKEENRSIAQQTVVILKEGLGLKGNYKLRRKALLENIAKYKFPAVDKIDVIELIREDRNR